MPRHTRKRSSKHKAIALALGRLGWKVSGRDVVALLASYGIYVTEGLVSKVKVDGLKKSGEVLRMRMQGRLPALPGQPPNAHSRAHPILACLALVW